jgi:hypothetical protein
LPTSFALLSQDVLNAALAFGLSDNLRPLGSSPGRGTVGELLIVVVVRHFCELHCRAEGKAQALLRWMQTVAEKFLGRGSDTPKDTLQAVRFCLGRVVLCKRRSEFQWWQDAFR